MIFSNELSSLKSINRGFLDLFWTQYPIVYYSIPLLSLQGTANRRADGFSISSLINVLSIRGQPEDGEYGRDTVAG